MKKSLLVAGALAAVAVSGNALAIDVAPARALRVPGLTALPGAPSQDSLGTMTLTALGIGGPNNGYCVYLMNWHSPFNPNDVASCIVRERRTPVNPSCIANKGLNITTTLEAGPGAPAGATFCAGFDNLGIGFP